MNLTFRILSWYPPPDCTLTFTKKGKKMGNPQWTIKKGTDLTVLAYSDGSVFATAVILHKIVVLEVSLIDCMGKTLLSFDRTRKLPQAFPLLSFPVEVSPVNSGDWGIIGEGRPLTQEEKGKFQTRLVDIGKFNPPKGPEEVKALWREVVEAVKNAPVVTARGSKAWPWSLV